MERETQVRKRKSSPALVVPVPLPGALLGTHVPRETWHPHSIPRKAKLRVKDRIYFTSPQKQGPDCKRTSQESNLGKLLNQCGEGEGKAAEEFSVSTEHLSRSQAQLN